MDYLARPDEREMADEEAEMDSCDVFTFGCDGHLGEWVNSVVTEQAEGELL